MISYANSVLVSHYNFKTTITGPSLRRACVLLLGIMRCSSTKVNGKKWQSISTTRINFWKHNCMSVPDSNMPSIRLLLIYTSIRNLSHLHSITRLNDCSVFVSTQPRQRQSDYSFCGELTLFAAHRPSLDTVAAFVVQNLCLCVRRASRMHMHYLSTSPFPNVNMTPPFTPAKSTKCKRLRSLYASRDLIVIAFRFS